MSLPAWVEVLKTKEFNHRNGYEIFQALQKTHEALSIAWEALDRNVFNPTHHEMCQLDVNNCVIVCPARRSKDAMRRIEELGK